MATTWLNQMRITMSVAGAVFEGRKYTFKPLIKGKAVATCPCPHCEYKTSTLWMSNEDINVFASLCPRCKAYEVRRRGSRPAEAPKDTRCLAVTAKGHRCKNKANEDGFCNTHSPKKSPQAVQNQDGSGSVYGDVVGLGL